MIQLKFYLLNNKIDFFQSISDSPSPLPLPLPLFSNYLQSYSLKNILKNGKKDINIQNKFS